MSGHGISTSPEKCQFFLERSLADWLRLAYVTEDNIFCFISIVDVNYFYKTPSQVPQLTFGWRQDTVTQSRPCVGTGILEVLPGVHLVYVYFSVYVLYFCLKASRMCLCCTLSTAWIRSEQAGISHRDLPCGNSGSYIKIFVIVSGLGGANVRSQKVSLTLLCSFNDKGSKMCSRIIILLTFS